MSKTRWNPTTIKRVLKDDIDSSTCPVVVLTDKGTGYFKALGNPEGAHVLAREFVGTSLANLLGIPTFEYSIFHFNGVPEIQLLRGGIAQQGAGFITKKEHGDVWNGKIKSLKHITNPEDITRLVCLDTWVRNTDRYSLRRSGEPHSRSDNVFLSRLVTGGLVLKAYDFTHALFCTTETTSKAHETTVYGLFPEFKERLDSETAKQVCDKLKTITTKRIKPIIGQIPDEWEIDLPTRETWIKFIVTRASYLSKNFMPLVGLIPIEKQQVISFSEEVSP